MPEKYTIENRTVENILGYIRSDDIAIPEIQRPFVWSGAQVRDLIDSLYNGYPAGYLIIWQNPKVRLKDGSFSLGKKILIDGQQRVTSLMTAIDGREVLRDDYQSKPIKIAFNPWAAAEEPAFEVQSAAHEKDKKWIPDISRIFAADFKQYAFIREYQQNNPGLNVTEDEIAAALDRLKEIIHRQIGVITLAPSLDINEVTEIFVRINSQGKVLNEADFAMSKIAADFKHGGAELRKAIDYFCHLAVAPGFYSSVVKDSDFATSSFRDEIKWLKDDFKEIYDPDYSDLLRVAMMYKFGRGRLKDLVSLLSGRDFKDRTFKESIVEESFASLTEAVHSFVNQYSFTQFVESIESAGFISPKLLRAKMPLDFAYTLYLLLKDNGEKWGIGTQEIKRCVRKWFVLSTLTGRYSGSPESAMDQDLRGMAEKGFKQYLADIEAAQLGEAFWNSRLVQDLETSAPNNPSFNVFRAAQVYLKDRSLLSDTSIAGLIESGDSHHIFPKEFLKQHSITKNLYNQVANLAYLETPINIAIGKRAPADYFTAALNQCQTKTIAVGTITDTAELLTNLDENCIPRDIATMTVDDYESKFLPIRRRMMAQKIRKYYECL